MSKQDQLGKNETFCVKWGQNTYLALSSWAWSWSRNAGGHAWSHLVQILCHASSSPPPASVPSPACSSFSPIKHTSYITYILEWTFLYWSFWLWDVIRDFSRLFCSDIRAKSESNFICQIWQSDNQGDEGKCIIPATLNYPRWRRKKSHEQYGVSLFAMNVLSLWLKEQSSSALIISNWHFTNHSDVWQKSVILS